MKPIPTRRTGRPGEGPHETSVPGRGTRVARRTGLAACLWACRKLDERKGSCACQAAPPNRASERTPVLVCDSPVYTHRHGRRQKKLDITDEQNRTSAPSHQFTREMLGFGGRESRGLTSPAAPASTRCRPARNWLEAALVRGETRGEHLFIGAGSNSPQSGFLQAEEEGRLLRE